MGNGTVSDVSSDLSKEKSFKPKSLDDKNATLVHKDFKGLLIGSKRSAAASAVFGQKKG